MHIITHRRIVAAQKAHPQSAGALDQWYRLCRKAIGTILQICERSFPAPTKWEMYLCSTSVEISFA